VLADQQLGYDVTNRHVSTALDDGTVVTYLRDATNRIVERKVTKPGMRIRSPATPTPAAGTAPSAPSKSRARWWRRRSGCPVV
jgi:hypothetical protein